MLSRIVEVSSAGIVLADCFSTWSNQPRGLFNPQSSAAADVQAKLTSVHRGEEVLAQEEADRQR